LFHYIAFIDISMSYYAADAIISLSYFLPLLQRYAAAA